MFVYDVTIRLDRQCEYRLEALGEVIDESYR